MVGLDGLLERVDDLAQLRRIAVLEQQIEERVRVALLQVGERGRVGREPRLVRAGLRHGELVEEHLLKLLRRSQVDLAPDLRIGGRREGRRGLGELHRQPAEDLGVDRDSGELHLGEDGDERQLDVAQHPERLRIECVAEVVGDLEHVPGLRRDARRIGLGHELVGIGRGQGEPEEVVDLRGEVLLRPAGLQEPRRDAGVEGEAAEFQPDTAEQLEIRFRVEEDLGCVAREPGLERGVIGATGSPRHVRRVAARREAEARDAVGAALDAHREGLGLLRRRGRDPVPELLVDEGADDGSSGCRGIGRLG